MFKNATFFRLVGPAPSDMEEAMESHTFEPCSPSQDRSVGWVPPRGEANGKLLESVGEYHIVKLAIETKSVPSSEIDKVTKEAAKRVEDITGRRPGKKEMRELKDEALQSLLPKAFPKRKDVSVLFFNEFVVIDSSSSATTDAVVTQLVRLGLTLELVNTVMAPQAYMKICLIGQDSNDDCDQTVAFAYLRECEMVANDESKAKVSFKGHNLSGDSVLEHLRQGKEVTKLALCNEEGTSFVMTKDLVLKKLEYAVPDAIADDVDSFDADVVLKGSALQSVIKTLIEELGGVVEAAPKENVGDEPATEISDDQLYDKAVEIVLDNRKASISLVQRHLSIGYNRAARLIEMMEANGLVSAMGSDGHREILKEAA